MLKLRCDTVRDSKYNQIFAKFFYENINSFFKQCLCQHCHPDCSRLISGLHQVRVSTALHKNWLKVLSHSPSIISFFHQVKFIYESFRRLRPGIPLMALYGKQKQLKRVAIYNDFCKKTEAVLFATDIAARGLGEYFRNLIFRNVILWKSTTMKELVSWRLIGSSFLFLFCRHSCSTLGDPTGLSGGCQHLHSSSWKNSKVI